MPKSVCRTSLAQVAGALYHRNSEKPNNRTGRESTLNCPMHIQWRNKVEQLVLRLNKQRECLAREDRLDFLTISIFRP